MFALMLLLGLGAGPAKADDLKARQLHEKAAAAFEAHRYAEAAQSWREAYGISRRPLLLFNVGQALKKAAEGSDERTSWLERARAAYQDYLDVSSGNEPERVDALRAVLDIDRELAPARPPAKLEPTVTVLPPPAPPVSVVNAPEVKKVDEASTPLPWWKHPAFWIGAGVVVAAGSTAGVVLATRCRADLGCLDAR